MINELQPAQRPRAVKSLITLANAGELVSHIVKSIAGNDVASTINNSRITHSQIRALAQARFAAALSKQNPMQANGGLS